MNKLTEMKLKSGLGGLLCHGLGLLYSAWCQHKA